MAHYDYIPRADGLFDGFFGAMLQYVTEKTSGTPPAWGHIPQAAVDRLAAHYSAWRAAYEATIPPHAKPQTDAKNEARAAAEAFIRPFVNQYLRFPPVTDSDRDAMRIHNKNVHPSPVQQPDAPPDWSVRNDGLLRVRYDIRPAGAERPHIPAGYNGANIYYAISDAPITDINLLTRKELLNRGISIMQLTQAEDGKYLSASLEWETHTNLRGPKSEIQSIKIR